MLFRSAVTAANLNITPEELFKQHPLNVVAERMLNTGPATPSAGMETGGTEPKVTDSRQIFTGRADDTGEGWGASRGSLSEGNRQQLLVDKNGNYFWGERMLGSARDEGRVVAGKHADFEPAKFASTREARAAAEADRKSTRLNSSHSSVSRMPSSA